MKTQDKKKKLRARADKLFTLAVFKKWGRNCEVCGKPAVTAHHYIPKSLSQSLRYDLENGVPICNYCHMSIHTKNDPGCIEKIISHRGRNWAEYIEKMRRKEVKITVKYYEDNIKRLEECLKTMRKEAKRCKICNKKIEVQEWKEGDERELCFTCKHIEDQVRTIEEGINLILLIAIKTKRQIKLSWKYKK